MCLFKEYAEQQEAQLQELFFELVRIPAPTGKEERRAQFCLNWLRSHGAQDAYTDDAGNVLWRYHSKGKQSKTGCDTRTAGDEREKRPLVVFDAHMDVVFPDETELPLMRKDGNSYCPGAGDDTANLAVLLMMAAYAAQEQPDTGMYDLLFVCGVGEEGLGNLKGVREVCRVFGEQIEAFYALDLTLDAYTCRAVGSLRYQIAVHAKGGHSYHDFGTANAIAVLAQMIGALYRQPVAERGMTTYNVGTISGGTTVNAIAQQAQMLYEIRSDDRMDLQDMEQQFEQIVQDMRAASAEDVTICVTQIGQRPCEAKTDAAKRTWLFAQAEQIIQEVTGSRPVPQPCSTDCNLPLSLGIPSICVGLCKGAGAHTREEYVEEASLVKGLQVGLQLLADVKRLYERK